MKDWAAAPPCGNKYVFPTCRNSTLHETDLCHRKAMRRGSTLAIRKTLQSRRMTSQKIQCKAWKVWTSPART